MKNVFLCLVLIFIPCFSFAEVLPLTFGANVGTNMENEDGYAFVVGAYADYEIFKDFKAGLQFTYSSDFNNIYALDPVAYAKWYTPLKFAMFTPYVKGNLGLTFITLDGYSVMNALFGADVGVSVKLSNFLIEPYLTFGYPYFWGFGVSAGYSLK